MISCAVQNPLVVLSLGDDAPLLFCFNSPRFCIALSFSLPFFPAASGKPLVSPLFVAAVPRQAFFLSPFYLFDRGDPLPSVVFGLSTFFLFPVSLIEFARSFFLPCARHAALSRASSLNIFFWCPLPHGFDGGLCKSAPGRPCDPCSISSTFSVIHRFSPLFAVIDSQSKTSLIFLQLLPFLVSGYWLSSPLSRGLICPRRAPIVVNPVSSAA